MLTALVFIPLLGSIILMLMPRENQEGIKRAALALSLIPLAIAVYLWTQFDFADPGMQFVRKVDWIRSFGISYHVGVDGISLPMLLVTGVVSTLAILASFNINHRVKDFFALMLLLQTSMYGVFVALDYFLFFIFFKFSLVPMYFLIGIWGGPRREYAAIKFFIYTFVGSVLMLIGILALYFTSGLGTFDALILAQHANLPPSLEWWIFLAFYAGFAVKVPVWPLHAWLPDAHVEAPTAGSMILAGVLLKMGTYGFYRFMYPTLPDAAAAVAPILALLAVIGIVYGAFTAMGQKDLKQLLAYSSVSHIGFVMLALAAGPYAFTRGIDPSQGAMAMNGGLYVMISHGLISPLMFYLVGTVFYERSHARMIDEMGGYYIKMPVAGTVLAFTAFANLGLPGLSGFVGEFFTLVGTLPVFT